MKNIVRWTAASVAKHFDDNKGSFPLLIDLVDKTTINAPDSVDQLPAYAELRISGPDIRKLQGMTYYLLNVNIICVVKADDIDTHLIYRMADQFAEAASKCIHVYRFGDSIEDDDSFIGCYDLRSDLVEPLRVNHLTPLDIHTRLCQSTVDGRYRMEV